MSALILPFEEGLVSPVVGERLRRLEIRDADLFFELPGTLAELLAIIQARDPYTIVFDSIQACSLTPDDLLNIARSRAGVVLALMQVTKEGTAAGSNAYLHLADVNVEIESMRWRLTKSL
jgi:predicted ATP-dependent serine protease